MIKKLLILTLLLVGCTPKKDNIVTFIKEKNNCVISINYPQTTIKTLNKQIKKDIKKTYKNFKMNYCKESNNKNELNIDFKYEIINNNYINILIKTNINKRKETKTYLYNIKDNKYMNVYDVFTENDLDILSSRLKQDIKNIKFTFDDKYLYIHNNQDIKYDIELFDLKIDIKKETLEEEKYTYKETTKIIDPNSKVLALTFDDGPSKYTKQIVDLLKEYDYNATFFILGNKVEIYKDTLKYLLDNGNEIGNHSYNHKWLTHITNNELETQINETQKIIKDTLNYTPTIFRPTYGSVNKYMKENIKLDIILWNIDTLDWKYKNSNKIANNTLNKVKDTNIILMHDTYEYTYNALKIILPKLKKQGYQLVTITELKNILYLRNENK